MRDPFNDFWNDLVNPVSATQADTDYAAVADAADSLPLTPQESYNVAWGPDATPEAWLRERAQQISDEINGAESTAILRRGRAARPLTQAEKDAEAARADAVKAGVVGADRPDWNGGGGDGGDGAGTTSGSSGGFSSHAPNDQDNALGTTASALSNGMAGRLGGLVGNMVGVPGPIGSLIGSALNNAYSSQPGVTPDNTRDVMAQMDAQARENEANRGSNDSGGYGATGDHEGSGANSGTSSSDADSSADNGNNGGAGGNSSGDNGSSNSSGDSEGSGANSGTSSSDSSSDSSDNGMYQGGKVTPQRLRGPDPQGPDDGFAALDVDEFVVRQSAAELYGDDVMAAINEGRIPVGALRRLIQP